MTADPADELLRRGKEALDAANWKEARSWFDQARELGETPEVSTA